LVVGLSLQSSKSPASLTHDPVPERWQAIDKAALLKFDYGTLGGPPSNVAPFGSPANGQAESAVIHSIVASCDFY
jgi:hypothetical protein